MLDMWNEIILPCSPAPKYICLFICIYLFQQHAHIFSRTFQFWWFSANFCPKTFKSYQIKSQFRKKPAASKTFQAAIQNPFRTKFFMVDPSYNLQDSVNKSQQSPIFHVKCASLVNMTCFLSEDHGYLHPDMSIRGLVCYSPVGLGILGSWHMKLTIVSNHGVTIANHG